MTERPDDLDEPGSIDLTRAEYEQAIRQLLRHAGWAGVTSTEMDAALDALLRVKVNWVLWQSWACGEVEVGWSTDDNDLRYRLPEEAGR